MAVILSLLGLLAATALLGHFERHPDRLSSRVFGARIIPGPRDPARGYTRRDRLRIALVWAAYGVFFLGVAIGAGSMTRRGALLRTDAGVFLTTLVSWVAGGMVLACAMYSLALLVAALFTRSPRRGPDEP